MNTSEKNEDEASINMQTIDLDKKYDENDYDSYDDYLDDEIDSGSDYLSLETNNFCSLNSNYYQHNNDDVFFGKL